MGDASELLEYVGEYKGGRKMENLYKKTVVVYALGGLTYGEIAMMRNFARECGLEITIVVSDIVNTERFVNSFKLE